MTSLQFQVQAECPTTRARAGLLTLPHGQIETPVFMPVGTKATVKSLTPEEVENLGGKIVLSNTFHLMLRPGDEIIRDLGGLHRFMGWNRPILTDSGGFQVWSLAKLAKITEEGVAFRSPLDGSPVRLTPERSIAIQENLGADIIMAFDECIPAGSDFDYARQSTQMTARWAERCQKAHQREDQALFGIVQGGTHAELRVWSAHATVNLDFPGYAVGGLSVGESKQDMAAALDIMDRELPRDRPRYLMGVGTPQDFLLGVERGIDMFDCVLPTRTARTGRLYTATGTINIRNADHARDPEPIDPACPCPACAKYSRAYLRHLFMADEMLGPRLATLHNLSYFLRLMDEIRQAILENSYAALRSRILQSYPLPEATP